MGTRHEVLGRVVVVKPYRKHGNGAKGGGRLGNSGKKAELHEEDEAGNRTLLASAEGATAKDATQKLRRAAAGKIPPHVAINPHGETNF